MVDVCILIYIILYIGKACYLYFVYLYLYELGEIFFE